MFQMIWRTKARVLVLAIGLLVRALVHAFDKSTAIDVAITSIAPVDPVALGFDPIKLEVARAALSADVTSGKIPGAYLIIGRHGKIAFRQGFGVQGPGQETPVSEKTLFRIFSMTKPIVSVAAMALVEEGKLDLDAPISKYLPEFADIRVWRADGTTVPASRPILVRQLMSHTSGLIYAFIQPREPLSKVWVSGGETRDDLTTREYARMISKLPLRTEPGTAWYYSRSTDVLGALLEVVSGKPLDALLREKVTGPLGMTDTAFVQPESNRSRFAEPATTSRGVLYDYARPKVFLGGGGGLSSTPEDYVRFVLMLAGGGNYRGVRIIKAQTLARMLQDETTPEIRRAGLFFPGRGMGFGLGFSLVEDDSLQRPGKGTFSWWGIAGTEFWVDPKNDVFVIFMMQAPELATEYQKKNRQWVYDALMK